MIQQRFHLSRQPSELDRSSASPTPRRAGRRWSACLLVAGFVLAGCGGGGDEPAGDANPDAPPTSAEASPTTAGAPVTEAPTTQAPLELPELGPESALGEDLPDGTYAAAINSVDAENAQLGLNLVTVTDEGGVPVATDEDPLGLVDLPTNNDTEILLLPTEGGGLRQATQRELWNTMGKKDTGFAVGDSTVLFFRIEGGAITKIEQQAYIELR